MASDKIVIRYEFLDGESLEEEWKGELLGDTIIRTSISKFCGWPYQHYQDHRFRRIAEHSLVFREIGPDVV